MASEQILIVEDDGIIASRLKKILTKLEYDVLETVPSGEETIQIVGEILPDLVLMDIYLLGDLNGIETADQIHTKFDIPVVYLTAYADDVLLQQAQITEPYGYLVKPIQEREVNATIKIALYKHKMETRLKENEMRFRAFTENTTDVTVIVDEKGVYKYISPSIKRVADYTVDEVIGKVLENFIHPDDFPMIKELIEKSIQHPHETMKVDDFRVQHKNGSWLYFEGLVTCLLDTPGVNGIVAHFRDITDRKRLEEEIQKAEKLEAVGVLAGGIAHDFNNLLTGIIGNISLAKMYSTDEKVIERLIESEKASWQARELTQRLLTFAKGGVLIKETASVSEIIKDTAEFVLRGSNVKCEFSFPDDLWLVKFDSGQISQVIRNLVLNADQAMPEGGIFKIGAENMQISDRDNLPMKEGKYIKITIEDEGIGISKENLPKIFDPYFTTQPRSSDRGTGLGLAICDSIIKKHNGYITVESELGVGTTFYIYLPAYQIEVSKEVEERIFSCTGRILVMDDEEIIRDVAKAILKHLGYDVVFAEDGSEAIELYQKAKKSEQPFDAVILDLTIPGGMGGKRTVEKLLEIDPEVKAIVSSGYSNDPIMYDYEQYGFKEAAAKPYNVNELSEILRKVMRER